MREDSPPPCIVSSELFPDLANFLWSVWRGGREEESESEEGTEKDKTTDKHMEHQQG
jgi:hypothetical protein